MWSLPRALLKPPSPNHWFQGIRTGWGQQCAAAGEWWPGHGGLEAGFFINLYRFPLVGTRKDGTRCERSGAGQKGGMGTMMRGRKDRGGGGGTECEQ